MGGSAAHRRQLGQVKGRQLRRLNFRQLGRLGRHRRCSNTPASGTQRPGGWGCSGRERASGAAGGRGARAGVSPPGMLTRPPVGMSGVFAGGGPGAGTRDGVSSLVSRAGRRNSPTGGRSDWMPVTWGAAFSSTFSAPSLICARSGGGVRRALVRLAGVCMCAGGQQGSGRGAPRRGQRECQLLAGALLDDALQLGLGSAGRLVGGPQLGGVGRPRLWPVARAG